jgi:uncharacterized protein YuzE
MSKVTYDPTCGAVYIYAIPQWKTEDRKVKTKDLGNHVYIDFDEETGELLGIEIMSLENLKRAGEILEQ